MTKEAKIGMLTGLGVIVLIGVLLSEYLGDTRSMTGAAAVSAAGGGTATGRMAELPIGENFRQQVMEPIGVPGMARGDAPLAGLGGGDLAGGTVMATPPTAYAAENKAIEQAVVPLPAGPSISKPVAPIAVGPAPMEQQASFSGPAGGPPTISVAEAPTPVRAIPAAAPLENVLAASPKAAVTSASPSPAAPAAQGTPYVIAAGDNLAKIAKRFYQSSKISDIKRIVAANPGVLKDMDSPIIAGKTLTIPDAAKPATPSTPAAATPVQTPALMAVPVRPGAVAPPARAARPAGAQPADPSSLKKLLEHTTEPVMIYLPTALDGKNDLPPTAGATVDVKKATLAAGGAAVAKKDAKESKDAKEAAKKERTYEVQAGDTLEKIAKKYAPSNPTAFVAKLKAANGAKATTLQKGQKLKIPS